MNFVISLVYLADVLGILNSLNISLQGIELNNFSYELKVQSLQNNLALWGEKLNPRTP
jgi:hypothetical protein